MNTDPRCAACGATGFTGVLTFADAPVFCNVLADTDAAARSAPTGTIDLAQCDRCGLLANLEFDEGLANYQPGYENSLHHSAVFQEWARSCAERLVKSHDLAGGTALEVGCGSGGFLSLLRDAGMATAIGYDPSFSEDPDAGAPDPRVQIHAGLLDAAGAPRADLAVTRHVLEHVTEPLVLLELLARTAPEGVLYLEVPDATAMLTDGGIYDVIYEHCSYFGAPALQALVARCGLSVLDVRTTFGGQYLSLEAVSSTAAPAAIDEAAVDLVRRAASDFGDRSLELRNSWADRLERFDAEGRDVVVWGAGSKGVTFVNLVEGGAGVSRLVDLNPLKWGRFVPGTAQEVVGPDHLVGDPPDVAVVMNPLYAEEVALALRDRGVDAEVIVA